MPGTPQLPYAPARMVRWYGPLPLLQTGNRVWLSTILGADLDRRQIDPRNAPGRLP